MKIFNNKVIIPLFFLLLFTTSYSAQSLINKSNEEFNIIMKEAITNEDFDLANKITEEIKSRKTIDEKISEKNTALNSAIAIEDYDKAEQIKKEIEQLKTNKIKIKQLEEEKKTAITLEDYDRVIAIDKEIKALYSLKPKNDRPLSTEQEIDFLIASFGKELEEFDKTNGKYKIFKGEQRTQTINSFKQGQNDYVQLKERVNELTDVEENGIHYGFLVFLKLSKDQPLISKYHQYYLTKVTKTTPYTDVEKINININVSSNRIKNLAAETPDYQTLLNANNFIIKENNSYLNNINNLSAPDKQMINIYFDAALFSSDLPIDLESVNRFFK